MAYPLGIFGEMVQTLERPTGASCGTRSHPLKYGAVGWSGRAQRGHVPAVKPKQVSIATSSTRSAFRRDTRMIWSGRAQRGLDVAPRLKDSDDDSARGDAAGHGSRALKSKNIIEAGAGYGSDVTYPLGISRLVGFLCFNGLSQICWLSPLGF